MRAVVGVVLVASCASTEPGADGSVDAAAVDAPRAIDAGATDAPSSIDSSTDAASTDPGCWPFDPPPLATLRASEHLVFAHYFSAFPISIDDHPAATDYYATGYLDPAGEHGAHAYCGGFLRERPWPQTPWPAGVDYEEKNMEIEVRRAAAIGLDGFTFDVLDPAPTSVHRRRLDALLTAASAVDPGFRIQLVLDMTTSAFGGASSGTDAIAMQGMTTLFDGVGSNPALQRLSDGRIVVSAFAAERRSAAFWQSALTTLATMGYRIALVPMPVGGWAGNASHFAGVPIYGASSWGTRTVIGAAGLRTAADAPHAAGLVWMSPVAPQDSRPKDLTFVEADNSMAYRAQWEAAITAGADWVQLITWNDYSEDSEMALSSRTRTVFYDLAAYYVAWLKTGVPPPIVRDGLYLVHRTNDMHAMPDLTMQRSVYAAVNGPTTSSDMIEVVGMLVSPATLEIEIAGHTSSMDVGAGLQSFRIPLVEGTPIARIVRGGSTMLTLTSESPISNTIVFQDPLYHGTSSTTCAR